MSGRDLYETPAVWDQALQPGQDALLQAIRDLMPAGVGTVLDVGCGDGKISGALAAATGCRLYGLDISAEALARFPLPAVRASAARLPFADGAFDLVISTDMAEHLPEAVERDAWREMFRVARHALMVAVPFREVLEEAIARCARCGGDYHVNWHQRRYDFSDLEARAVPGWRVEAFALSGEPWSPMLRAEILARRWILGERAGWEEATCPHCGAPGSPGDAVAPLPRPFDAAVGRVAYRALSQARELRSHSEVLAIFVPEAAAPLAITATGSATARDAARVDAALLEPGADLIPYPQCARLVRSVDGRLCAQLPLYGKVAELALTLADGIGQARVLVEDGIGLLLEATVSCGDRTLALPREAVPGYYGLLVRFDPGTVASIGLPGQMPVLDLAPAGSGPGYIRFERHATPVWVQALHPCWIDPGSLPDAAVPETAQLLSALARELASLPDAHGAEGASGDADALREIDEGIALLRQRLHGRGPAEVALQNLLAEREALQQRARELDRVLVELQNAIAERDALRERSRHADRAEVELQNASAERDALRLRAREADALAVQVQNLEAELDALRSQRDGTQQQLARLAGVEEELQKVQARLQALQAERDALGGRLATLQVEASARQRRLEQVRARLRVLGPLARRLSDWINGG